MTGREVGWDERELPISRSDSSKLMKPQDKGPRRTDFRAS